MTSTPSGSTRSRPASISAVRWVPSWRSVFRRRALLALDEHAHRAVGQLQQLQDGGDDAEIVERVAVGIVLGRIELGDQEDALVRRHRAFQRRHRFVAADEQRHDHVREDDDVAQRQDGIGFAHVHSTGGAAGPRSAPYMGPKPYRINEAAVHASVRRGFAIDPLQGRARNFAVGNGEFRTHVSSCFCLPFRSSWRPLASSPPRRVGAAAGRIASSATRAATAMRRHARRHRPRRARPDRRRPPSTHPAGRLAARRCDHEPARLRRAAARRPTATEEAVRGGVGTTATWQSETRPGRDRLLDRHRRRHQRRPRASA